MKRIPDRLWDAVTEICRMQHPSLARILRNRGFGYEADKLDELAAAHQQATENEEKRNGNRNARRARRH
jgi:hypothetical protein